MENAVSRTYNEYDMYRDLQEKSGNELSSLGLSKEEINNIKTKSYSSCLRERSIYSEEELRNMGYSIEQIDIIKDPNATDEQLLKASATLTITTVIEKLDYHPNNYTYSTVYIQWIWSSKPYFLLIDDLAIAWTEQMAFMPYSENNKSRYTLYKRHSQTGIVTTSTTGLTSNDYVALAAGVKTPGFFVETSATPPPTTQFIYKGAARVALKHYGMVEWLQAQGAYAHYTFIATGISLTCGFPSINFDPTDYVYRAADDLTVSIL